MNFSGENGLSGNLETFQSYVDFLDELRKCISQHFSALALVSVLSENLKFVEDRLDAEELWDSIIRDESVMTVWGGVFKKKDADLTELEGLLNYKIHLVERKIQEVNDVLSSIRTNIDQQIVEVERKVASKKKEVVQLKVKLKRVVQLLNGVEKCLDSLVIGCRSLLLEQVYRFVSKSFVIRVIATASENVEKNLAKGNAQLITLGWERNKGEEELVISSKKQENQQAVVDRGCFHG